MNLNNAELYLMGRLNGVRARGNQWSARCPFHDDARSSLSLNTKQRLWICHAGCGQGRLGDFLKKLRKLDQEGGE